MAVKEELDKLVDAGVTPGVLSQAMGTGRRIVDYWRQPAEANPDDSRAPRPASLRTAGRNLISFGMRFVSTGLALLAEADSREKEGPPKRRRRKSE